MKLMTLRKRLCYVSQTTLTQWQSAEVFLFLRTRHYLNMLTELSLECTCQSLSAGWIVKQEKSLLWWGTRARTYLALTMERPDSLLSHCTSEITKRSPSIIHGPLTHTLWSRPGITIAQNTTLGLRQDEVTIRGDNHPQTKDILIPRNQNRIILISRYFR